ncbi:MAG: chorismate synthase [Sphaerochaetaceae bacterium]|nr:chorismate synthase [Sphaerochaetaceae bacterium]
MKNTIGSSLCATLFGESHGSAIGIVLDGLAPGIEVSNEFINFYLSKRRPSSITDTSRREMDKFQILSGVFNGRTTGTPLTIVIPNENTKSSDYEYGKARPSHADYVAHCKYKGFEDYRGGGHFSGRITAALVASGGILLPALEKKGIFVASHICNCSNVEDQRFSDVNSNVLKEEIMTLKSKVFPVLNDEKGLAMVHVIEEAKNNLDSVGGLIETAICGLPVGIGEPWFDSLESLLSHGIFSIGGIKGIEFGKGFGFCLDQSRGSNCNDELSYSNGDVVTLTNNNGGINGGISNGMPVVFRCAVKPTPSISQKQNTIDFVKKENIVHEIHGRHDPAIIRRICPVIDSVTALVVADALTQHFGTDYLKEG